MKPTPLSSIRSSRLWFLNCAIGKSNSVLQTNHGCEIDPNDSFFDPMMLQSIPRVNTASDHGLILNLGQTLHSLLLKPFQTCIKYDLLRQLQNSLLATALLVCVVVLRLIFSGMAIHNFLQIHLRFFYRQVFQMLGNTHNFCRLVTVHDFYSGYANYPFSQL